MAMVEANYPENLKDLYIVHGKCVLLTVKNSVPYFDMLETANMRRRPNVGLLLCQRRRGCLWFIRWFIIGEAPKVSATFALQKMTLFNRNPVNKLTL